MRTPPSLTTIACPTLAKKQAQVVRVYSRFPLVWILYSDFDEAAGRACVPSRYLEKTSSSLSCSATSLTSSISRRHGVHGRAFMNRQRRRFPSRKGIFPRTIRPFDARRLYTLGRDTAMYVTPPLHASIVGILSSVAGVVLLPLLLLPLLLRLLS